MHCLERLVLMFDILGESVGCRTGGLLECWNIWPWEGLLCLQGPAAYLISSHLSLLIPSEQLQSRDALRDHWIPTGAGRVQSVGPSSVAASALASPKPAPLIPCLRSFDHMFVFFVTQADSPVRGYLQIIDNRQETLFDDSQVGKNDLFINSSAMESDFRKVDCDFNGEWCISCSCYLAKYRRCSRAFPQ